jgi:hypothetical protein
VVGRDKILGFKVCARTSDKAGTLKGSPVEWLARKKTK